MKFHTNYKKTGMAMLISVKVYFKKRNMTRKKEVIQNNKRISSTVRYNNLKRLYFSNNTVSKYTKENLTELKDVIDKSAIIIGNFNIPLSVTIGKKSRYRKYKQ